MYCRFSVRPAVTAENASENALAAFVPKSAAIPWEAMTDFPRNVSVAFFAAGKLPAAANAAFADRKRLSKDIRAITSLWGIVARISSISAISDEIELV